MRYLLEILILLSVFTTLRMLLGPTIWDRLLAFSQLSSKVVIGIVLFSLITDQNHILDVAIVFTLFSFMSNVLIAHFIKERGEI